jgi:16S rRNA (adenine1518-N6/adenine1519-N6)-dimethyltransferase
MPVRPKKGLGQHFLRDENIARKIVQGLDTETSGNILEIGPGTGILTGYLLDIFPGLYMIELDEEAWTYLRNRFPLQEERAVHGDFLKSDLLDRIVPPISIIGNFPYNISSQIFFRILEYRHNVEQVICMIQKEVAERIRSPHGSKTYGILSVLLQAFYDIELLFNVSPRVFNPPPKVQSSVLRLKRNKTVRLTCDENLFFRVVKTAFNQRRKTLRNSLKGHFEMGERGLSIFDLRPEQLSVGDFIELTALLGNGLSS